MDDDLFEEIIAEQQRELSETEIWEDIFAEANTIGITTHTVSNEIKPLNSSSSFSIEQEDNPFCNCHFSLISDPAGKLLEITNLWAPTIGNLGTINIQLYDDGMQDIEHIDDNEITGLTDEQVAHIQKVFNTVGHDNYELMMPILFSGKNFVLYDFLPAQMGPYYSLQSVKLVADEPEKLTFQIPNADLGFNLYVYEKFKLIRLNKFHAGQRQIRYSVYKEIHKIELNAL